MKPKHITITGLSYDEDDRFLYRPGRVFDVPPENCTSFKVSNQLVY